MLLSGCVPFLSHRQAEHERTEFLMGYLQNQASANVDRTIFLRAEIETLAERISQLEARLDATPESNATTSDTTMSVPRAIPDRPFKQVNNASPAIKTINAVRPANKTAPSRKRINHLPAVPPLTSPQKAMSETHRLPAVPPLPSTQN